MFSNRNETVERDFLPRLKTCSSDQKADVAQSFGAWSSELEDRQFDPRHLIDVCFDFPLYRVAVALITR